jgi:stress response protein YsnF
MGLSLLRIATPPLSNSVVAGLMGVRRQPACDSAQGAGVSDAAGSTLTAASLANQGTAMTDANKTPDPEPLPGAHEDRIAVIAQRLDVEVAERETGTVRVRKITHTDQVNVPVVLKRRLVTLERVPVNRFVEAEFAPRQEGDTLVVPVFEYVPVTDMKLMLKEEIRIGLAVMEEKGVHLAEVQRQEIVVERRTGTDGDWVAQPAAPSSDDVE